MARRHAWLQDYEYQTDKKPEELPVQGAGTSPVNVTININLGDIIDKMVKRRPNESADKEDLNETLDEMIESKRKALNEVQ